MEEKREIPEKEYAIYQVSLKALIRKNDEFLFLRTPRRKLYDLPGGRIDEEEKETTPFADVLAREVGEELGDNLKYKLGKLIMQFRKNSKLAHIPVFNAVYEAEYLSGEISLSNEHSGYEWINPKNTEMKREDFFNDEEYAAFQTYFTNLN
jgi:8-oxo-dGTP pyrophosphatase MutT (NUDIX family)